ncbi:MAG: response regulator [Armatimonadetes bacterium]|nr:response regulator [Armatimonadota bacterium]
MAKLRVLVADDDPIIRLDLKQMLQNLDYEVVAEAGDGQEAVDLATSLRPDICVLDIKMPIKDGITAVSELVQGQIAPAILLTAYSDRELIDRAKEAGAFAYLVKPFKPNDLPPAIEVAVSRYQQNKDLAGQIENLNERLETRKLVEKAKSVLIEKQGLSESEAYRRMQQSSMNTRKSMKEVAEAILLTETLQ